MAFAIRKREKNNARSDMGLLDSRLLQSLQDRFCVANDLYLACLSRKQGVITKAYGSKEELAYIHGLIGMDMHVKLLNQLMDEAVGSVVEINTNNNIAKLCGVSICVGGEVNAIWIVIGIMKRGERTEEIPDCIMQTTSERFYKSIEFLETLSRQVFAVKMDEILAQKAFFKSRESEGQIKAELKRNEAMTSIVRMLESENSFTKIVDDILEDVCEFIGISHGALFRENVNEQTVDMICEYNGSGEEDQIASWQNMDRKSLPFFTGKPYMISANSMMPHEFQDYFEKNGLKAGIFLPIDINGRAGMYLCFFENKVEKVWDVNDIKFITDVKRIIQSILVKRIAKNSLASSYASLEAILENVGCGIYVRDGASGHVLYTNQKFQESFAGFIEKYRMDRKLDWKSDEDLHFEEYHIEEENRWFDFHGTHIQWVDGRTVELGTIYDITEKKLYQQKIERQANNDFLTGLYNRRRCERDLDLSIKKAQETGTTGGLLYIDLDDFKHINDGLGHRYGDILLQNIAQKLLEIPGVEDHCYRVGGDEFIIIVSTENTMGMYNMIEDICVLFEKPWLIKDMGYYCTMSMGVVQFPLDGTSVEELIKKADIALYDAKCAGKNRVSYFNESATAFSIERLDMEKCMRNAVINAMDEFQVYYQPITDVQADGMPCAGAEALVRWNSKELGFISPGEFIPLAEYLGLIVQIGEHILKQACNQCKYWNEHGMPDFTINVNLSVIQLLQNDIIDIVQNVLEETGLIPDHLHLEVTESLAVNDMERMKKILGEIKKLGVKVALDDFGTGYSSLNHIREMPIDIIKIDRCFIIDIGKDDFSGAFVKMVTELANAIHMKICVEGVETKQQLDELCAINVHLIQGYYFGKPMPKDEFEKKFCARE